MVKRTEHFDCTTLLKSVQEQEIGLCVSTNHPEGFRRLLYLHMRQHPNTPKCSILQSPDSSNSFFIIKEGFKVEAAAANG